MNIPLSIKCLLIIALGLLFVFGPVTNAAEDSDLSNEDNDKPMSYAEYSELTESGVIIGDGAMDVMDTEIEEISVPEATQEKHIIVSLADQRMWVFEGNTIVQRFLVSTGVRGHSTPTGSYSVHNRSPRAYSRRYECYMLQWMAITADGVYGMHALEGTRYERYLGSVASHGCIRLSHVDAQWLYNWVEIGTKVEILADYEEPPEQKNIVYRVSKRYCL